MTGELDNDLLEARTAVLRQAGASGAALDEVLAYTRNPYRRDASAPLGFPLADEAHVSAWREYADDAAASGAFEAIRRRFPQLRFPIRKGISAELEYIEATKRGVVRESGSGPGISLVDPDGLELAVLPTVAGHVPVLVARAREDFVTLVQAFTERNEPAAVPATMGACLVNGLINWDRVARCKAAWLSEHALADEAEWRSTGFPKMAADKSLYQDRLVILSRGPYSALGADRAGLTETEWLDRSLVIRREHELTHYCTWRLFGQFRTHAHDELLADFVGLVRAFDTYPPELASELLGVSDTGPLAGGRLRNYKGSLSDEAFTVVARLSWGAVRTLDSIARRMGADLGELPVLGRVVYGLSQLHLEELAARDALERFERAFEAADGVTDVGPGLHAPAESSERARRSEGVGAGVATAHRRARVEPRAGTAVEKVLSAFDRLAAGDAEMVALTPDFHLVIDEIISNVERHGSASGTEPRLWCELVRRPDTVEMIVVDDGPAFDPLQQPEPRLEGALEDRPVGGLGIFLVRRLMSDVRYERRDGRNRLRLTVRFTPAAPDTPTPS
jgi:anti-sigma regulatory factor (Ser/Thr protein kinase)